MDDIDNEDHQAPVSLVNAQESADVSRSDVFCSRIIQQRSNHQVRFRRSSLFMKILKHSYPELKGPNEDGSYPRPLASPFPCFQCHRRFETPPVFLPLTNLDGSRSEYGNFCGGPCGNTYLQRNMNDSNYAVRSADFFEYMQDVHGFRGKEIGFAPHFSDSVRYGGHLSDAQFDKINGTVALTTRERMAPFVPTEVVIEYRFEGTALDEMMAPLPNAPPRVETGFEAEETITEVPKPPSSLTDVMGTDAESADHHRRWDVHGLRQPPKKEIEARLASLPPLEKRTGLYDLYLQRHGENPSDDDESPPSKKRRAAKGAAASCKKGGLSSLLK